MGTCPNRRGKNLGKKRWNRKSPEWKSGRLCAREARVPNVLAKNKARRVTLHAPRRTDTRRYAVSALGL